MQKNVRARWPLAAPRGRERGDAMAGRRLKRLAGRLNLFQATMLDWRDMHPYNAVHAVRISQPLDASNLTRVIDATLVHAGLTGLELDRGRGRYAWHGGAARTRLEVLPAGSDWQVTLAQVFERELNAPFPRDGRIEPFRFFAIDDVNAFFLGLAYDHFIAGGDSIVVLLNAIAAGYAGNAPPPGTLSRYPRTHRRLFLRHPWWSIRGAGRFPAMAASCRRTVRPRYRSLEDGHNAYTFFTLEPVEWSALRSATKRWGVTLNDALIALLLLAQDGQLSTRDRSKRRNEIAVASIMNLRDAHGEDVRNTFGQFLSSFRVSHPVPPGTALEDLAKDVHRLTARIKREKLFLTTLCAIAVDRVMGRFQTRQQRLEVYAKSYPVHAGVSSLNVNTLWISADGSGAPLYIRGVPTGPASPVVFAVTTSGDTLCAGVSYRTSAFEADAIARIQADIRTRIHALT